MRWNQVETKWRLLANRIVFGVLHLPGGDEERSDRSGPEISSVGHGAELQLAAFRPDDGARRSEYSLHIGC